MPKFTRIVELYFYIFLDLHITRLEALVLQHTQPLSCSNTDEWPGYGGLQDRQRVHRTVNHSQKQWARDQDGGRVNEVHTNTIEGLWTGFRNFLRPFRGVCKWYLYQYCAVHEWTLIQQSTN